MWKWVDERSIVQVINGKKGKFILVGYYWYQQTLFIYIFSIPAYRKSLTGTCLQFCQGQATPISFSEPVILMNLCFRWSVKHVIFKHVPVLFVITFYSILLFHLTIQNSIYFLVVKFYFIYVVRVIFCCRTISTGAERYGREVSGLTTTDYKDRYV